MFPVLLDLGRVKLYAYGLLIAIGLLAAVKVSKRLAARSGAMTPENVTDLYMVILVSALIGSRGLYVLISFDSYKDNLMEIFKIWNGGLVFFGGFITAVVGVLCYIRIKKLNLWQTADIIAPGVALGHMFGRIGCFLAGCCYGKECSLPWAVKFTNPQSLAPLDVYLHPTQLYSALSNLSIFLILLWVTQKKSVDGMVFLIYLMIYAVFRGTIEFFRGDFRGHFLFNFLSLSQGIGLLVFIIAGILLIIRMRQARADH